MIQKRKDHILLLNCQICLLYIYIQYVIPTFLQSYHLKLSYIHIIVTLLSPDTTKLTVPLHPWADQHKFGSTSLAPTGMKEKSAEKGAHGRHGISASHQNPG